MHNGSGQGNGKRWLLIGLLVLGGFWLVNDAYDDGFRDAMVQSGQAGNVRVYRGGPHFPWGLVILGGIGYIAWRKGAFDRFGGGGGGGRYLRGYGYSSGGYAPAQPPQGPTPGAPGPGYGPAFRGPRGWIEDWHRQAHEAMSHTPATPPAQAHAGNGVPPAGGPQTPPPPPPAPDYWASMARAAEQGGPAAPITSPAAEAGSDGNRDAHYGATGPAPERW